jgi:hypothetical protein
MSLTALADAEGQVMMQPPAAVRLLECLSASQRSAHDVFLGQKPSTIKDCWGNERCIRVQYIKSYQGQQCKSNLLRYGGREWNNDARTPQKIADQTYWFD